MQGKGGVGVVVRGVYSCYFLAVFGLDPFIIDEETNWLSVFTAIGGCKLD